MRGARGPVIRGRDGTQAGQLPDRTVAHAVRLTPAGLAAADGSGAASSCPIQVAGIAPLVTSPAHAVPAGQR
jgi:hypothetical protein